MSEFKVGDRVNCYGSGPDDGCWSGIVTCCALAKPWGAAIEVKSDYDSSHYAVHPKQCRLLRKKERRRVWLKLGKNQYEIPKIIAATAIRPSPDWINPGEELVEFIEVRAKDREKIFVQKGSGV